MSKEQFSKTRPVLNHTINLLENDRRCKMYIMYDDATVFAFFDVSWAKLDSHRAKDIDVNDGNQV